jgi:hypothetical protein
MFSEKEIDTSKINTSKVFNSGNKDKERGVMRTLSQDVQSSYQTQEQKEVKRKAV